MEPTDIQLMLRVRQGDLEAYRLLVERYRAALRRFLAAMLPDRALADDAVQETFLRLWTLRERYSPTGRFSTYLFQIARNHALNVCKRHNLDARDCGSLAVPPRSPEGELLARERAEGIEDAIRSLPAPYRSVFLMSHIDGMKYAEIAACLGIPVGTVKSRMSEAVRRLRLALAEQGDEQ